MSEDLPYLVGDGEQRMSLVFRGSLLYFPATLAAIAVANALLPPPEIALTADRLAFALRWIFVALLPFIAIWFTILIQRMGEERAHNPLLGNESHRLQVHCRVMQNTLEQFTILAVCVLAAAGTLPTRHLDLIPILCTAFAGARLVYWRGYLDPVNCLARSTGTQITTATNSVAFCFAAMGLWRGFWG